MDGWTQGRNNGEMDGCSKGKNNEQTNRQKRGRGDGRKDHKVDRQTLEEEEGKKRVRKKCACLHRWVGGQKEGTHKQEKEEKKKKEDKKI